MCCYFGWIQGVEIIRGCRGLNLVGCDLVEVSPPYDTTGTFFFLFTLLYCINVTIIYTELLFSTGNTALTGANLLFEMLCVLPKIKYFD